MVSANGESCDTFASAWDAEPYASRKRTWTNICKGRWSVRNGFNHRPRGNDSSIFALTDGFASLRSQEVRRLAEMLVYFADRARITMTHQNGARQRIHPSLQ